MCLDTITKKFSPNTFVRHVFKGFDGIEMDKAWLPCSTHNGEYSIPRGVWLKAESPWVTIEDIDNEKRYRAGFHCYKGKTKNHFGKVLVRVRVRGIMYEGVQDGDAVIVARELFVPLPEKKKRKRA